MTSAGWLVTGFTAGVLAAGIAVGLSWDARYAALQHTVDSVAAAAIARGDAVGRYADSLRATSDSLERARRPIIVQVVAGSVAATRADSTVATATTVRDSNIALVAAVAALRAENAGLRAASRLDALALTAERARGDSLRAALHDATAAITILTARVHALGHRPPRWIRLGLEATKLGLVGYAGYQLGRATR